jgi:hypothetical protein
MKWRRAGTLVLLFCAIAAHAQTRVVSVVEPEAAIGRTLTLRVDGPLPECKSLILFIQRSPIQGLTPRCGNGTVAFTLQVNEKNADTWHRILGGHWFTRNVIVGLGPNDAFPYPTFVNVEPFRLIQRWHAILMTVVALLLVITILCVRRFTTLLDSLARMQIAMWVVVIALSYVYIWSITGETATINASALALLAIGGGTAIGAAILKSGRTVDVKMVVDTIKNAPADQVTPSEIAGPTGLHALMIATWTIVLAVVFLATVFRFLHMPEFSAAVLAILGISGGTYLAFSMPRATT